jgi:hypothetical protein
MAGNLALYAENKVLELLVGKTAFSTPTAYVGLFTTNPTHEDGTGGVEASAGNYARKSTAGSDWNAAADGSIDNVNDITFIECASSNWGTILGFGIWDAASAGNMIAWADLDTSKEVTVGDTFKFAAGDLTITAN